MKNIDEIDDNINELILQKSFDKLTVEEKEKALAYAGGEEEYNSLRTTLLAITTSFGTEEEAIVDQDLKSDLLNQFEKKFGSSGNRVKIIPIYRQPLFQLAVAASVALLVIFTMPFFNPSSDNQGQLAMNPTESKAHTVTGTIEEKVLPDASVKSEAGLTESKNTIVSDLKDAERVADEVAKDEGPLKSPNMVVPILENKGEDMIVAEEDPKKEDANKNIDSKSKPNNLDVTNNASTTKKDENDFMYERVVRERKEAELAKGKKKSSEKSSDDIASNDRDKKSSSKMDADKMLESAAGTVNEANFPAPPGAIISSSVNAYVDQNKTEILDLLFTTF